MPILDNERLAEYVEANGDPGGPIVDALHARTAEATGLHARMSISEHQARFLEILTRTMNVRLAVEVGTFTGRSSLAIALGLPEGGRLICCDISDEWTTIAREAWAEAGVADRIELRIGPAIDTLAALDDSAGIDLAFIDADKPAYIDYYEAIVPRLRVGGIVLADNVLWSGRVVDDSDTGDDTRAIRAFNAHVLADERTLSTLLPIGDGVSVHQRL